MMPTEVRPDATPGWRERFIEELGGLVHESGMPRAVVRVLGWMAVCEPPEQTASTIGSELKLSSGSVSTATHMLVDSGMLERIARPGDRHIYYRLHPGGWERALEVRFHALVQLRKVADRALDSAGDEADHRLRDMRDVYARFETNLGELLKRDGGSR
jgi:DNA-binding transcriptional regulator GbsR (MarR family)